MSHYPKEVPWELPKGWVWTMIDDIAFVTKLAGFEYTNYIADNISKTEGVPLFKGKNVQDGEIIYEFESFIPKSVSNELPRSQVRRKCLLTPYVGTLGNIGIHQKEGLFHLGSNVGKIEILNGRTTDIFEEYVKHYLQSSDGYKQLTRQKKATAQDSISIEAIREVLIPIPPREEQRRILAEIERWFAFVSMIESSEKSIKNMIDASKALVLDLAIHGKLLPQDPSDEPALALLKRINPAFKPSDNLHYVGELPKGWQLCHIQDIAKVELGKTLDRIKNSGSEVPYLCALNVKWDGIDLSTLKTLRLEDAEKNRYRLLPNDLLVCEGGDVGRCAIWRESVEMYYQNALHRVRFYDRILPEFFLFVLRFYKDAGVIDDICKGVTIKHFTGQVFRTLDLPFPPINEQKRIVDKVNCLFNSIDLIADMINAS